MSKTITDTVERHRFEVFDSVSLTRSLFTVDIYGEPLSLRKGKSGCVLQPGDELNSYLVEFRIGDGMRSADFTAAELSEEVLFIESSAAVRFENADLRKSHYWF